MSSYIRIALRFLSSLVCLWACTAGAQSSYVLNSPDKRIQVVIELPQTDASAAPHWSAWFRDKPILTDSRLGLQTTASGELMAGARVVQKLTRHVDRRIPVLFGKADHADDRFSEVRFMVETLKGKRLEVTFRCYDDAIAFRYTLPTGAEASPVTVADETTSFQLVGNPTAYAQYLENYTTSHEHNVSTTPYEELRPETLLDMPLTVAWPDGTCAAITEAALRHYAGMSLMRSGSNSMPVELVCRLTPRPDGTKVVRPLPMQTPWRVLLIGERPGALLESGTLYCLNEPSVIKDVSWMKPGKMTWPWWNGDVYDGRRNLPILSLAMASKYIDFCASNGIPTHSLTSTEDLVTPWYQQSTPGVAPGPDTDATRPRPGFDLAGIRRYADSRHVRLWTWVHQAALRGRVEEAFTAYEKLGWSGMMIDFFDHDDQESVEFAESILEAAARHHILIHFHGIWKPTGWQRTYPNLMNHEGALNLEYLKWSDRCPPEHNLMMAFTRLVAGPMDYHLGGFRAVRRAEFKPRNIAPNVLGTRGHHLALYVCFDNPNPMIADYPVAYEGQAGFDFLKLIPTWWDETRVVAAELGEVLVTARRKGKTWYVGGISAKRAREVEVPVAFLGKGQFSATVWKDAADAESDPNHLEVQTLNVSGKDTPRIRMAVDGGFVMQIAPVGKRGRDD